MYFYGQRGGVEHVRKSSGGEEGNGRVRAFVSVRCARLPMPVTLREKPLVARLPVVPVAGCKGRCNELVGADLVVGFLGLFPAFFLLPFTRCDDGS